MTYDDESDDYDEWRAQARAGKPPATASYARFVVGYQFVVTVVLLVAALLLAVTGNADTAALMVILAVIAAFWGLLHRRYTAR